MHRVLKIQSEVMDKTNKLFDDLGAFKNFPVEKEIETKSQI